MSNIWRDKREGEQHQILTAQHTVQHFCYSALLKVVKCQLLEKRNLTCLCHTRSCNLPCRHPHSSFRLIDHSFENTARDKAYTNAKLLSGGWKEEGLRFFFWSLFKFLTFLLQQTGIKCQARHREHPSQRCDWCPSRWECIWASDAALDAAVCLYFIGGGQIPLRTAAHSFCMELKRIMSAPTLPRTVHACVCRLQLWVLLPSPVRGASFSPFPSLPTRAPCTQTRSTDTSVSLLPC